MWSDEVLFSVENVTILGGENGVDVVILGQHSTFELYSKFVH